MTALAKHVVWQWNDELGLRSRQDGYIRNHGLELSFVSIEFEPYTYN